MGNLEFRHFSRLIQSCIFNCNNGRLDFDHVHAHGWNVPNPRYCFLLLSCHHLLVFRDELDPLRHHASFHPNLKRRTENAQSPAEGDPARNVRIEANPRRGGSVDKSRFVERLGESRVEKINDHRLETVDRQ